MFRPLLLALFLALTACAPIPPSPADIEAKHFQPAAGQAVIYLVRSYPDLAPDAASVMLDDQMMGSTYPGTYARWVVPPGRHEVRGYAGDNGRFVLDVPPDGVYFVQQSVVRGFTGFAQSRFQPLPDGYGRAMVMRSELIGGR